MDDFFEWASDAVGTAFDWLKDNPDAAGLAVAAVSGGASYLATQEASKNALELEELRQRRTDNRHYAQYASPDGYIGTLTADGGILTNGLLAKQMGGS